MLHGSTKPARSRPRRPRTVESKLRWALPALRAWAGASHTSLREITREQCRHPHRAGASRLDHHPAGMCAQAICEDRILHEAHATRGDIRRLCDLFGFPVSGAGRYTATVGHPALAGLTGPAPN